MLATQVLCSMKIVQSRFSLLNWSLNKIDVGPMLFLYLAALLYSLHSHNLCRKGLYHQHSHNTYGNHNSHKACGNGYFLHKYTKKIVFNKTRHFYVAYDTVKYILSIFLQKSNKYLLNIYKFLIS